MFREIKRRNRSLTEADAREILGRAEHGVMATLGEDGWPYAVPLNHVLAGNDLYAHCALKGHKLDNIAHEERVSFCAVASATVVPATFSTLYESAIVFGRASLVVDEAEKRVALKLLTDRFCGDRVEQLDARFEEEMSQHGRGTAVIRIRIEHITGKAHRAVQAE